MTTFTYEQASITIERASAITGVRRSILVYRGSEAAKDEPEELAVLRTITYPDLIAPVTQASGLVQAANVHQDPIDFSKWPIPFEDFIRLPDDMIVAWEAATYKVNPHWSPGAKTRAEEEEGEKKI